MATHMHVLPVCLSTEPTPSQREGSTADTQTYYHMHACMHARMHACLYMCGSSHTSVSAGMTVSVVWHLHESVQANMSHAALLLWCLCVHVYIHTP